MLYLLAKLEKNDLVETELNLFLKLLCEEWKCVCVRVCFSVKEMKMSIMHGCVDTS